jgi:hypothetical protein
MGVEAKRTDSESLEGRMKLEPGGMDANSFKRAEAATRVVMVVCLLLDFALVRLLYAW